MHALDSVAVNFTAKADGVPESRRARALFDSRSGEIRFNCTGWLRFLRPSSNNSASSARALCAVFKGVGGAGSGKEA